MARLATKVAMSLPVNLYRAVERARKKTGRSRSAILQDALRLWLDRQREAALVKQYEAGYRTNPETLEEVEAAGVTGLRLLSTQEW